MGKMQQHLIANFLIVIQRKAVDILLNVLEKQIKYLQFTEYNANKNVIQVVLCINAL